MDQVSTVTAVISISTTVEPPSNDDAKYGLTGLLVFALVLVVIFIARKKCSRPRKHDQDGSEHSSFQDSELSGVQVDNRTVAEQWRRLDDTLQSLIKGIVIEKSRLDLGKIIGKGQFGCVYEASLFNESRTSNDYGNLSQEKVAVKTLKGSNVETETIEAFLQEGMIMKDFHHRNVLTLIGVAIGDYGVPIIVLPFMANGNLRKYMAKTDLMLTVRDLLDFGRQVASGMEYLSLQKFVHRDLATRNCMLDSELVVKVADFGLSRDIYTKDYYSSEDKTAKLPVKWMALESLTRAIYTTKTDIWSYGVLLWELMTRGATPYPDVSNWDIRSYIQSGRRMQQPETCPDEIYDLMLRCWDASSDKRPTFNDVVNQLNSIVNWEADPESPVSTHDYWNMYINIQPAPEDTLPEPPTNTSKAPTDPPPRPPPKSRKQDKCT